MRCRNFSVYSKKPKLRFLVGSLAWIVAAPLVAQQPRQQPGVGPQAGIGSAQTVVIDGVLTGGNANVLSIKQNDGGQIFVSKPDNNRSVTYRVDLPLNALQRGMFMRFSTDMASLQSGSIAPKGMELFTEGDAKVANVRQPNERVRFVPGIYPLQQLGLPTVDPTEVRVVGQIVGMKDASTLAINAGGRMLPLTVDPTTMLSLRTYSVQFAKPGDRVTGQGITYNPQGNQVIGRSIEIIGSVPTPQEQPQPRRRGEKSIEPAEQPVATPEDQPVATPEP